MATLPQILKVLRDTAWDISMRFGADIKHSDKTLRAGLYGVLGVQSIILKRMLDKGLMTEAEMMAAINAVRTSDWTPERLTVQPQNWDTTPVSGFDSPAVTGV